MKIHYKGDWYIEQGPRSCFVYEEWRTFGGTKKRKVYPKSFKNRETAEQFIEEKIAEMEQQTWSDPIVSWKARQPKR